MMRALSRRELLVTVRATLTGFTRPRETEANCVHAGPYGTRSSSIAVSGGGAVRLWTSDGPPCTHPLLDRSALFVEG
jgi:hypothetical protein